MADRVVVMREGRIEQAGTPRQLYEAPRTRWVAGFVGRANLWDGVVREAAVETPIGLLRAGALRLPHGTRVTVVVRPEASGSRRNGRRQPFRAPGTRRFIGATRVRYECPAALSSARRRGRRVDGVHIPPVGSGNPERRWPSTMQPRGSTTDPDEQPCALALWRSNPSRGRDGGMGTELYPGEKALYEAASRRASLSFTRANGANGAAIRGIQEALHEVEMTYNDSARRRRVALEKARNVAGHTRTTRRSGAQKDGSSSPSSP